MIYCILFRGILLASNQRKGSREFGDFDIARKGGTPPVGVGNRILSLHFRRPLSGFFSGKEAWLNFPGLHNRDVQALGPFPVKSRAKWVEFMS
jgi:hypothetical protein